MRMMMVMRVMMMHGMVMFMTRLLMITTVFPLTMIMARRMMPLPGAGTSFQYRLFLIYTHQLN